MTSGLGTTLRSQLVGGRDPSAYTRPLGRTSQAFWRPERSLMRLDTASRGIVDPPSPRPG